MFAGTYTQTWTEKYQQIEEIKAAINQELNKVTNTNIDIEQNV